MEESRLDFLIIGVIYACFILGGTTEKISDERNILVIGIIKYEIEERSNVRGIGFRGYGDLIDIINVWISRGLGSENQYH